MVAVLLGAFAAHGLSGTLSADQLQSFQTGVRYQMYHSLAMLFISGFLPQLKRVWAVRALWLWAVGVLFFSGSIYLLSCRSLLGFEGLVVLGPVTPLGGLCFILGWGCSVLAASRVISSSK